MRGMERERERERERRSKRERENKIVVSAYKIIQHKFPTKETQR